MSSETECRPETLFCDSNLDIGSIVERHGKTLRILGIRKCFASIEDTYPHIERFYTMGSNRVAFHTEQAGSVNLFSIFYLYPGFESSFRPLAALETDIIPAFEKFPLPTSIFIRSKIVHISLVFRTVAQLEQVLSSYSWGSSQNATLNRIQQVDLIFLGGPFVSVHDSNLRRECFSFA